MGSASPTIVTRSSFSRSMGTAMLGKRVRYRGRVGTVVAHASVTELLGKSVVIRFPGSDDDRAEEVNVPQYLWPLIEVLDE